MWRRYICKTSPGSECSTQLVRVRSFRLFLETNRKWCVHCSFVEHHGNHFCPRCRCGDEYLVGLGCGNGLRADGDEECRSHFVRLILVGFCPQKINWGTNEQQCSGGSSGGSTGRRVQRTPRRGPACPPCYPVPLSGRCYWRLTFRRSFEMRIWDVGNKLLGFLCT